MIMVRLKSCIAKLQDKEDRVEVAQSYAGVVRSSFDVLTAGLSCMCLSSYCIIVATAAVTIYLHFSGP